MPTAAMQYPFMAIATCRGKLETIRLVQGIPRWGGFLKQPCGELIDWWRALTGFSIFFLIAMEVENGFAIIWLACLQIGGLCIYCPLPWLLEKDHWLDTVCIWGVPKMVGFPNNHGTHFLTKNDQHLGCEMEVPPFKESPHVTGCFRK